jgi:glycosyltransferase involved in cell wall biosynthesis
MKVQFLSRRNHFMLLCKELIKYDLDCEIIPLKNTRNSLALPTLEYIKKINSDVLVSHNPFHGLIGGCIAKKLNKINYLVMHLKADYWTEAALKDTDLRQRLGYKIKMLQNELSMDDVNFIIAISEWVKKIAYEHGIKKNIYTIHHGVDIEKFHPGPINPDYKTQILCVLNFNVPKKIELLNDFIDAYKDASLDYMITFLGEGRYIDEIKKHVKSIGLDNLIEFRGYVKEIQEYYKNCEILIHPSNLDSFSMVLLEAMASGKPVVTRDIGGIPELVVENETGFITNDMDAFIEHIEELMQDEDKKRKMGESGLRHVRSNFTWEKAAKKYVQAFKSEGIIVG